MKVNYTKYGMSKARYQELAAFARQYSEFIQQRKQYLSGSGSVDKDGTEAADLKTKIELIENCAKVACSDCPGIVKYLMQNVTEGTAYERMNVPMYCEGFRLRRKLFFIELNKHKK